MAILYISDGSITGCKKKGHTNPESTDIFSMEFSLLFSQLMTGNIEDGTQRDPTLGCWGFTWVMSIMGSSVSNPFQAGPCIKIR